MLAAGADYRVRIFTPTMELPFAGHPSIGTAWALAEMGRFGDIDMNAVDGRTVHQEVAVGVLPLEMSGGEITLGMAQPELIYRVPAEELDELAETLEVRSSELRWPGQVDKGGQRRAPAVISCGLPYLVVPISRLDLLADLESATRWRSRGSRRRTVPTARRS